jgi:uncharacterized RDD family membrane protein YckC
MKCPKCNYLGFETGDRCKNCGYDFSLITTTPAPSQRFGDVAAGAEEVEVDLTLHLSEADSSATPGWIDSIDLHAVPPPPAITPAEPLAFVVPMPSMAAAHAVSPEPASAASVVPAPAPVFARAERALPLFSPTHGEDDPDEPLIKLPAAPRPPLAVRKTPEIPRLRAVPKPPPRIREAEPVLAFELEPQPEPEAEAAPAVHQPAARIYSTEAVGAPRARAAAAAIDHAILLGIDAIVLYLTVRMAGLSMEQWSALPLIPLAAFLLLVKVGYFCAFTAVGGQTIGKMASHLRVVTDAGAPLDGAVAIRRTAAGVLSAAAFGLGFLPAFLAADRRALHDRVAGTRVVSA